MRRERPDVGLRRLFAFLKLAVDFILLGRIQS